MTKSELLARCKELGVKTVTRDTVASLFEKLQRHRSETILNNPNPDMIRTLQGREARAAKWERKAERSTGKTAAHCKSKAFKIRVGIRILAAKHFGKFLFLEVLYKHVWTPITEVQTNAVAA